MAPIFPIEQREIIQKQLLETGILLIREKGIKHMTVDDVTERVGIGKGTFYHFFMSKEEYVSKVIHFSKENLLNKINQIVKENGGIDKKAFLNLFESFSMTGHNNIISSISFEDEKWLQKKLPDLTDLPKEEAVTSLILKNMIGLKTNINHHVVSNIIKIMALAVENRAYLHQDALDENLSLMLKMLCDYLFV